MKLTTLLITAALLNVSAAGLSQNVTFSGKNVPLTRVFAEVEKQTGFVFIYAKNTLDGAHPVTIEVKNVPVETFLQKLLADQPIKFTIDYQTVLLSRKPSFAAPAARQPDNSPDMDLANDTLLTVKGTIWDEEHNPISGASIVIKKTGKGTTSNSAGQFELKNIPRNAVLEISSIGFETKTLLATDHIKNQIIRLTKSESKLDEVQIIAYGKTSQRLSTGNVTRVSGEELRKQPTINPMMALQGKVPGLAVSSGYAHPAAPVTLEIRGRRSVNTEFSAEPLYIIDGVPRTVLDAPNGIRYQPGTSPGLVQGGISYTGGLSPFFGINAEDIESIEILKDGDATAIYGSRGANGVVIITTRKPQAGATSFSLQWNQERTDIARFPESVNRETYFQIRREALRNDGIVPTPVSAPDLMLWDSTRYIDWQREIYQPGSNTRLIATLGGGDINNSFRLSASYSTMRTTKKIYNNNGTANVTFAYNHRSRNRKLNIDLNVTHIYAFTEATRAVGGVLAPNAPPIFDSSGKPNYAEYRGANTSYPWAPLFQPNKQKANQLSSSVNAGYEIIDGLTMRVAMGYYNSSGKSDVFRPLISLDPLLPNRTGSATFSDTRSMNWAIDPTINYVKRIGKGKLDITAGAAINRSVTDVTNIEAMGFTVDELIESMSNAAITGASNDYGIHKYFAVFGRINYQWENKYIINFNARRDGSSRFGPGRQFGNFGSVGLAWIASDEKWWTKIMPSFINFFKIRGSFGVSGSDASGDYQYISRWSGQFSSASNSRLYDYNGVRPLVPIQAVNQLYQWETVYKSEMSVDLELAKRFTISLAWYRDVCDDQLTRQPVPGYSGFPNVLANSPAKVENTGLEGTLNATIIERKDFNWRANFNIAANKNRLLAYPNLEKSRHASQYKIGNSLQTLYRYRYLGVNPLTGDYMFEDYNKDGVISQGDRIPGSPTNDAYVEKDMNPSFYGGFGTTVTWKSVSVSLHFAYEKTLDYDPIFSGAAIGRMGNIYVPAEILENSWRKPGDIAKYGLISNTTEADLIQSDVRIIDGSYIQLNNVAIAWQIPQRVVKRAGLRDGRISINTNNLFTFTRHKGTLRRGFYSTSEPMQRSIAFVLQFNF